MVTKLEVEDLLIDQHSAIFFQHYMGPAFAAGRGLSAGPDFVLPGVTEVVATVAREMPYADREWIEASSAESLSWWSRYPFEMDDRFLRGVFGGVHSFRSMQALQSYIAGVCASSSDLIEEIWDSLLDDEPEIDERTAAARVWRNVTDEIRVPSTFYGAFCLDEAFCRTAFEGWHYSEFLSYRTGFERSHKGGES